MLDHLQAHAPHKGINLGITLLQIMARFMGMEGSAQLSTAIAGSKSWN